MLASLISTCHAALGPGDVPPDSLGYSTSGGEMLLNHYFGKVVIVTFWATWCPQCIKELPILEAVQNKAGKANLEVIAVNIENADVFRRATRIMGQSMHLALLRDATGEARKAYGVNGIPHMVIIGRDGRILQVHRGYAEDALDDIVSDINQALTQAAPTAQK